MHNCRDCGEPFSPTPHQVRKRDYQCRQCRRAYNREWVARRKADGNPVVTGKMSREWHREYEQDWRSRPGVRERLAQQARRRRRTDPDYRLKSRARRAVRTEIEAGRMVRGPCEVCGDDNTQAHHDDYDKPLEIRWLCPVDHAAIHAKAEGTDGGLG